MRLSSAGPPNRWDKRVDRSAGCIKLASVEASARSLGGRTGLRRLRLDARRESCARSKQTKFFQSLLHQLSFCTLEAVERLAQVVTADAEAGDGAFQALEPAAVLRAQRVEVSGNLPYLLLQGTRARNVAAH